jgi:hypothetical protein
MELNPTQFKVDITALTEMQLHHIPILADLGVQTFGIRR